MRGKREQEIEKKRERNRLKSLVAEQHDILFPGTCSSCTVVLRVHWAERLLSLRRRLTRDPAVRDSHTDLACMLELVILTIFALKRTG